MSEKIPCSNSRLPPQALQTREAKKALRSCRPLEDPSLVARSYIRYILLVTVVAAALLSTVQVPRNDSLGDVDDFRYLLTANILFCVVVSWVLPAAGRRRIFLVRAFHRDSGGQSLWQAVTAAAGPGTRVMGIRAPRRRSSYFSRLFFDLWNVLRYAGSPYCDLEAGDKNWLARVVATLRLKHITIVLIDLRDLTENVRQEFVAVVKAMGLRRCGFVTDASKSPAQWIDQIRALDPMLPPAPTCYLLVSGELQSGEQRRRFVKDIHSLLRGAGQAKLPPVAGAVEYARQIVNPSDWKTHWTETTKATHSFTFLLTIFFGLMAGSVLDVQSFKVNQLVTVIDAIWCALLWLLLWLAGLRHLRVRRHAIRYFRWAGWRGLSFVACLFLLAMTLLATVWVKALQHSQMPPEIAPPEYLT